MISDWIISDIVCKFTSPVACKELKRIRIATFVMSLKCFFWLPAEVAENALLERSEDIKVLNESERLWSNSGRRYDAAVAESKKAKEEISILEERVNVSQRHLATLQAKVKRIDAEVQKERLEKEDVRILDHYNIT